MTPDVVTDGGVITYVGPSSGAPDLPALKVPVVMPGLWECHGHFTGLSTLDMHETMRCRCGARRACLEHVEAALDAGFTSVREAGGLGVHLARVVDEGIPAGPRSTCQERS